MFVNSAHHQAVKLGKDLMVIVLPKMALLKELKILMQLFVLAFNAPEFLIDKKDIEIFKSLIESSRDLEK